MYTPGMGSIGGPPLVGGGIALLPNTGGSQLLLVVAILSITVGSLILVSTAASIIAKKFYKN